ncbi:MAG TPA: DUF455 family protein [Solirubrobacteraceae bacterium]|nr:DUF455 family protein [Solirubrobacteraceae bacterium]
MAYDVDESAIRFSNYFHVLRELVHLTAGHLALEPRLEVKALLGDHLHDDARAVSKIRRRLDELRHLPGAPSDELTALLDRAHADDPRAYLQVAYGELKPALIAAVAIHLEQLETLIDEPGLRLLTQILHRQERHVTELPAVREHAGVEDVGALPVRPGESRRLTILPALEQPARDAFVERTEHAEPYPNGDEHDVPTDPEELKPFFHALMHAKLCSAELMARSSHEHPDMPWDFHVDMARQVWDEIRHAEIYDRLLATELGGHWGDYPIGFAHFKSVYRLDLLGRLALVSGTGEQTASWRQSQRRTALVELGQEKIARVLDYIRADEVSHAHNGVRWGTHLLGGDEQAYRDKVRELQAGLDRTGMPVQSSA